MNSSGVRPTVSLPSAAPHVAEAAARRHIFGETPASLREWLAAEGHARFRADQIVEWAFARGVDSFDQMTNLAKPLRAWLAEHADLYRSAIAAQHTSADGTQKLLLTWPDGESVETVWIPEGERHTACLSSQVGCPVGCRFCASGVDGVRRNLSTGEIVEQALRVRGLIRASHGDDARLTNIVMMGMGEPLANYDAVVAALRILNAPWGLGVGARKITLSTVGLPKQIRRLAKEDMQINLALSLHAPDDDLRRELIPWGKVPIADLLDACDEYFRVTGREITLEYVLLAGVNDRPQHAARLAALCRRLRCNVNLLRYNPVPGLPFERPSADDAFAFQQRLRASGVNAHLRTSRGQDIAAACGQLRKSAATDAGSPGAASSERA